MIADTLIKNIQTQGGTIICNTKVQELEEKEGRLANAICSNGERYKGTLFISDIHPDSTTRLIKQSSLIKRSFRNRLAIVSRTSGISTKTIQT